VIETDDFARRFTAIERTAAERDDHDATDTFDSVADQTIAAAVGRQRRPGRVFNPGAGLAVDS
jgi:hypothetical protein